MIARSSWDEHDHLSLLCSFNKKGNRKMETARYITLHGNIKEIQFLHRPKKKKMIAYI